MESNNAESKKKKEPKTLTVRVDATVPIDGYLESTTITERMPSEKDATRLMSFLRYKEGAQKGLNLVTMMCIEENVDEKGVPTGVPIGYCPDTDWAVAVNYNKVSAQLYIKSPVHERNANLFDEFLLKQILANPKKYLSSINKAHKTLIDSVDKLPADYVVETIKGWQRQSIKYAAAKEGDTTNTKTNFRFQYELPLTNENPAFNVIIVDKDNNPLSYHEIRGRHILAVRYTKNFVYYQEDKFGWTTKWSFIKVGDKLPEFKRQEPTSRITSFANQSLESVNHQIDQLCEPSSKKRKEYDGMPELDHDQVHYESMDALLEPPLD